MQNSLVFSPFSFILSNLKHYCSILSKIKKVWKLVDAVNKDKVNTFMTYLIIIVQYTTMYDICCDSSSH